MSLVNDIVKQMLETHTGGEKFFDNLDERFRDADVLQEFYNNLVDKYWRPNVEFVVSGKFGMFFANHFSHLRPVLVRGGLRHCPSLNGELEYLRERLSGIDCVFIDDSFFMGRTRFAIKIELERLGARLIDTVVIYDGGKAKCEGVNSLYRYYDHHPTQAEKDGAEGIIFKQVKHRYGMKTSGTESWTIETGTHNGIDFVKIIE